MTQTTDPAPLIRIWVEVFSSAPDRMGNSYHSLALTDTSTGVCLQIKDVSRSEHLAIMRHLTAQTGQDRGRSLGYGGYRTSEITLPIRQYNATVRHWPYLSAEDAAETFARKVNETVCPDGASCPDPICQARRYGVKA